MLQKLKDVGPLKILQNVAVKERNVFIVCLMSFFGKIKGKIGRGVSKIKQSSLFNKKREPTQEEQQAPITDVDITIAKLKSQKRKINDQIRKVKGLKTVECRQR